MRIICGISSDPRATDLARAVSTALSLRTGLEPVRALTLEDDLARAAEATGAELIVIPDAEPRERLAHDATVPVLVVRDATPLLAWARDGHALRAVLGWDDTVTTAAALDAVTRLRDASPVDVDIVHVYFPDEADTRYGLQGHSPVEPSPELEALLRRDIAHDVGELPGEGAVTITPARGLGHIGEHLLERAAATRADLVVVGNHHRDGLRRLSSVAARVLRDATASVLLVPQRADAHLDPTPKFRTAVVATDGSAFANRAIPYAYGLVEGGEVHLIHVVGAGERADDDALIHALLRLRPPRTSETRTIAHVLRDGDPAHAIATAAERVGADVVCIASHGRSGIARALVGSVTDRLLHVCRRPVLVLHPVE